MILTTIIGSLVSVCGIAIAAFFKGKSYALNNARKKTLEDAATARNVANNVNASSGDDIDKQLLDKWSRK
jgi:hypothetical protein